MFQEFIKSKIIFEGRGRSLGDSWKMPVSNPMALFVSLFPGPALRTQILQWLMSEGLVQASQKRDELTQLVNSSAKAKEAMARMGTPVKFPPKTGGDVSAVAEATDAFQYSTAGDLGIHAVDLFSPEARKRFPFLNEEIVEGQTIDDWFAVEGEPQYMDVWDTAKHWIRIDVAAGNYLLEKKGLPPFKYGGIDGYLQYVEKGDYVPSEKQRSFNDPNQQHGPDLSQGEMGVQNNHRVATFFGGALSLETRRYRDAVVQSQVRLNTVYEKILNEEPVEVVTPEDEQLVAALKELTDDLDKVERTEVEKSKSSLSSFYGLGRSEEATIDTPEEMLDENGQLLPEVVRAIKVGLKMPKSVDAERIYGMTTDVLRNLGIIDDHNVNEIVYSDEVVQILEKEFLKFAPQKMRAHFVTTALLSKSPEFYAMIKKHSERNRNLPDPALVFEKLKKARGVGGGKNDKTRLAEVLNKGLRQDPEINKIVNFVGYKLKGRDASPYKLAKPLEEQKVLFSDDIKAASRKILPKEKELMEKGYRWDINPINDFEKKADHPDWTDPKRKNAAMVQSIKSETAQDVIRVVKEGDKLYINIPLNQIAKNAQGRQKRANLPDWGQVPGLMKGGEEVVAGRGLGHRNITPPMSEEEWADLESMLLNGEMGEPIEDRQPTDITQTESAIQGAIRARNYSRIPYDDHFVPEKKDLEGDPNQSPTTLPTKDLLRMAGESLWSFAGDRAFQIGYVSDAEIKWNQEHEFLKQDLLNDPEADPNAFKFTKGLAAELKRFDTNIEMGTIESLQKEVGEIKSNYWNTLKAWAEKGRTPGGNPFTKETLKGFGQNAFLARVDHVGRDVASVLKKMHKKWKNKETISLSGGGGRQGTYADIAGAQGVKGRGDDVSIAPMSPEEKLGIFGEKPEVEEPWQPAQLGEKPKPKQSRLQRLNKQAQPPAKAQPPKAQPPAKAQKPTRFQRLKQQTQAQPQAQPQAQAQTQTQAQPQAQAQKLSRLQRFKQAVQNQTESHLLTLGQWREMVGTSAPYDGTKPKDGDGFNWWGAVGNPLGVSITGDADTSKEDPIGKGKHGKRKRKSKKQ